ncbi:MAG: hypothetical protein J1F36_02015 [Clostridiales bacterium]|nr:hypothetical protein [Clostridiales bacterium]
MSTRNLAFGGVICALSSMCIIFSTVFHLLSPLVIACVFYYICAYKCGNVCAIIVIIASNIIGFFIGGIGGGEILFSVLLFSPFSIIIYLTSDLNKRPWQFAVRAAIFAAFSFVIYMLFATVLKDIVGFDDDFGLGVYALGAVWTVIMTLFGFALDRGAALLTKRFIKHD